ncbi:hypothetical protein [Youngiibacter fragilis]|uniref:Uncharacterized protein n=1 Tax=Youngiibacter fragilis 232.1 TaxID=994573 RepID=V7IAP9_9CLOT|nr:hypothetical protein [Youngiibacter fragilis]ETA81932.1 hypothetical protein T472_0203770 [Youngiibacter fragilis 232.1]
MNNEIESSIISKAIIRAGIHFYEYEDALELINLCQKASLPILGIDSFIVTETKTQPFLEHSIDLSYSENSYEQAKDFLKLRKCKGFVFEVVY